MGINISLEPFKYVNVSAPTNADVQRILQGEHVGGRPAMINVNQFNVGDPVKIISDITKLMRLQNNHGGWISTMVSILGKVGTIRSVFPNGDLLTSVFGKTFLLNPECCSKTSQSMAVQKNDDAATMKEMVEKFSNMTFNFRNLSETMPESRQDQPFSVGDIVKIIENIEKVKEYQKGHGGWVDEMESILGKTAEVQLALPTGTLLALVSGKMCLLNSKCCKKESYPIDDRDGDFESMDHMTQQCFRMTFDPTIRDSILCDGAKGHTWNVQQFTKKYGDEDSFGDTALHDAISEGDEEIIDILINSPNIDFTNCNNFGYNALHQAAIKGNNFATERILQKCRDIVNVKTDDGFTALHFAVIHGYQEVVNTLLTLGHAQLDIRNNLKQTPFLLAASGDNIGLIELLLSKGADINAEDQCGNICLHLAVSKQSIFISEEDSKIAENIRSQLELDEHELPWEVTVCYLVNGGADLYHSNHQNVTPLDTICDQSLIEKLVKFASMLTTEQPKEAQIEEPENDTSECLLCSDKPANVLFQPCYHVLICDDCNKTVLIKKCLTCRVPIAEKIPIQDAQTVRSLELVGKFTCKVCLNGSCNVAFECGHTACKECAERLKDCHICRKPIQKRLKLY